MKSRKILLPFVLFLIFSFRANDDDPENTDVQNFINEVVDIMEAYSINKEDIFWNEFRNQVLQAASEAENIDQATEALRLALELLGDNHSFIRKQNGTVISVSTANCPPKRLADVSLADNVGYIKIPFFAGEDTESSIAFAEDIQDQIKSVDNQDLIGWIVDLRGNTGGDMWPMLAGIGPILGEGIVGYFIGTDGSAQSWAYSGGASRLNKSPMVQVSNNYELINPTPRVAVLIDQAVISSGEAIAIAFTGRENTQSFGSSTCGLSTGNFDFSLSDGSTLFLTVSYMADRERNVFGIPIEPDVTADDNEIIQLAIDYILN